MSEFLRISTIIGCQAVCLQEHIAERVLCWCKSLSSTFHIGFWQKMSISGTNWNSKWWELRHTAAKSKSKSPMLISVNYHEGLEHAIQAGTNFPPGACTSNDKDNSVLSFNKSNHLVLFMQ
jgi:hypothetical protein